MKKAELKFSGIILALLFSSWLMFHTFSYDAKTHEIQNAYNWSDFGAPYRLSVHFPWETTSRK
jgi:hypothetical protein